MTTTRLQRARSSQLLQGSAWILVGLAVQSVLGVAFWYLGSRVTDSDHLGRASALFTAIQFVNYASGLGLTIALARHATSADDEADSLFAWGIVATIISSAIGGVAFLSFVDSDYVHVVTGSPLGWVLFCAYTAGTSVGLLVDVRLMAARRFDWLVGRIAVTGLVRLPLVLVDVGVDADAWLYHLMLAPLAIGGVVAVPLLRRIDAGSVRWKRPATLASVARYSGVNWLATLASQAPQFVLPLLVAWNVSSPTYANFFLAWTVTGLVLLVPGAIAQVLLVEGSKDADAATRSAVDRAGAAASDAAEPASTSEEPGRAPEHEPAAGRAREALAFSLGLAGVAFAGSLAAGAVVPHVLGHSYDELTHLLPRLMAAGLPWAITSVRLSQARIRRDQLATVAITITLGLGILVPAEAWIPDAGTDGAVRAFLLGNLAAAVVATLVPQRKRWVPRLGAASG
jgi:O-antigen/teichoic acid export membrane protein